MKAQNFGFDSKTVLLLYFLLNITASVFSIPFGKISDRTGRRILIVPSYILYALVCIGFAFITNKYIFISLFFFYGIFTAMLSGAERALLVEMSPKEFKGTVLGIYGTTQGIGILLSSTIAGVLWSFTGVNSSFILGGILAFISALGILFLGIGKSQKIKI